MRGCCTVGAMLCTAIRLMAVGAVGAVGWCFGPMGAVCAMHTCILHCYRCIYMAVACMQHACNKPRLVSVIEYD